MDVKDKAKSIKESKAKAFEKIKKLLDAEDVEGQFTKPPMSYYDGDKFVVSWNGMWKRIYSEFSIDLSDSAYKAFSGYKCIFACRSLVHEKQLEGFHTVERALVVVGLKLCPAKEKKAFWDKYAVKYNAKLEEQRKAHGQHNG